MKKRITIYVDDDLHKKLKSAVALQGENVSSWFEKQIIKLIGE